MHAAAAAAGAPTATTITIGTATKFIKNKFAN